MFQSTHSLRSATHHPTVITEYLSVSIHALLAECDWEKNACLIGSVSFNPRTPCGVRPPFIVVAPATNKFQSTHSLRSATRVAFGFGGIYDVSIHALLAECDGSWVRTENLKSSFNPRTPCGVRPQRYWVRPGELNVSIHALLAECDNAVQVLRSLRPCFNPRTPCGVRRRPSPWRNTNSSFQSTHSLRSATCGGFDFAAGGDVSIHALLAECD